MAKSSHHHLLNSKNHANRALQIEYLESRELLSAVSPVEDAANLMGNLSALFSTAVPAESSSYVEMNLESSQTAAAPVAADFEVPQSQAAPAASALPVNNVPATQKIVVNTVDDTVNSDRFTSLREALQNAQDGAVITFAKSLKGKTIYVSSALVVKKEITIDASSLFDTKNDAPGLTIMTGNHFAMKVQGSKSVSIQGITFASNVESVDLTGDEFACGIYCTGKSGCVLNVQKCIFHQLVVGAGLDASAIGVTANFDHCGFTNIGLVALANIKGTLGVDNCVFYSCTAALRNNSYATFVSSTIMGSYAGIDNGGSSLSVNRCIFANNSGGPMISNDSGASVNVQNSLFVENKQTADWCCFHNNGTCYITNVTVSGSTRTFGNWGTMAVRNSICSNKNNGTKSITKDCCMTFSDSKLDSNYRPTMDSPCRNAGNNSYTSASFQDLAGSKRIMDGKVDIGCYESLYVLTESLASGKTRVWWDNDGAVNYTVKYRVQGTEKWTTKTVKGQRELTISTKNNTLYEVKVIPEGIDSEGNGLAWSLAKPGVKVLNKYDDTITFQISNLSPSVKGIAPSLAIKSGAGQNDIFKFEVTTSEKTWSAQGYSGKYTFSNNVLTLKGLSSNTKYNFQFAQAITYKIAGAISSFTNVNAATTKTCYNTPTIKTLSAITKGVIVEWNTVYGKNSTMPAQKYTIQYRLSGTEKWKTATSSATGNYYMVKNLKSGMTYEFRICASKDSSFMNSLYSGVKTKTAD